MPNTFFHFRQFIIHQDKCAMKVCTDACLFGAWVASELKNGNKQVLDIGAGTGLLSLMIAQKTPGTVHAVEIDDAAFSQSTQNFRSSPWHDRLVISHSSIQTFFPGHQYDLIISNPPFFENDLKAAKEERNLALHSSALSLPELLGCVKRLLKPGGVFAILLPSRRSYDLENVLNDYALYILQKVSVKQTKDHNVFRYIYLLTNHPPKPDASHSEIIIKDDGNVYTKEFNDLLKDYYLFDKVNL